MSSRAGGNAVDLWTEIVGIEAEGDDRRQTQHEEPQIAVVYRRKKAENVNGERELRQSVSGSSNESRPSFAPAKRISWNRALSTRGRTSVAVTISVKNVPQDPKPKRKTKPTLPKGKSVQPPNFEKERMYFQEVDAFELLEESPSPKKSGTWTMGVQTESVIIPPLSSVLQKWLISKKQNRCSGPIGSLSKILETPMMFKDYKSVGIFESSTAKPSEGSSLKICSGVDSINSRFNSWSMDRDVSRGEEKSNQQFYIAKEERCEDIEEAVRKLSVTSRPSWDGHNWDPFLALLMACGQSAPSTLSNLLSGYCDPESIVKVGEGTYGEAFKAGENVCKIVPFDGDLLVNGEVQKKSEELLEEAILSRTLNYLREHEDHVHNACTTFIRTVDLRVCQGQYDAALIKAWEKWDEKHGSENDHPKEFPDNQNYVVFVQEHGGKDLESFVLLSFDEARSLLVQVTLGLAVAEAAYEFEHRDLHWGNILLSRKGSATMQFTLEGRQIHVKTFGLQISIIDFTLSRINTGEDILFLDLSLDPELYEGPKGDKQSDTYRKMREVTEECWEGSFPKTNVLWLQYLVDILLVKKSFDRTSRDERELRSLKKRLNTYNSAKEATSDAFFSDLFVDS